MPIPLKKNGTPKAGWLSAKCRTCKTEFAYRPSNRSGLYCTLACSHEGIWKQRKLAIQKTQTFTSHVEAKRYLLEKYGHRCEICKRSTWMKQPIPLVLDHEDGNSDNWSVKNLRHICANCDRQQPTFGSRNKGNGRKARIAKLHDHKLGLAEKKLRTVKLAAKAKALAATLK